MEQKKKTPLWLIAVGVLAAIAGSWLVQEFVLKTASLEEQLAFAATSLSEDCPMMVDGDTRMDKVESGPGHRFNYYYTLINYAADEIDVESFLSIMRPQILNQVRLHPDMKFFRDHKITLNYFYKDKNGDELTSLEIRPTDYAE